VYELSRNGLDLSVSQRIGDHVELGISATNLIDEPVTRVHEARSSAHEGDEPAVREQYTLGRSVSARFALTY
jgi:hypothetical protein